jgi:hypothetical protein
LANATRTKASVIRPSTSTWCFWKIAYRREAAPELGLGDPSAPSSGLLLLRGLLPRPPLRCGLLGLGAGFSAPALARLRFRLRRRLAHARRLRGCRLGSVGELLALRRHRVGFGPEVLVAAERGVEAGVQLVGGRLDGRRAFRRLVGASQAPLLHAGR